MNLQVLEARDNILTELHPLVVCLFVCLFIIYCLFLSSIGCLSKLVQLDVGSNEIEYLVCHLITLQSHWLITRPLARGNRTAVTLTGTMVRLQQPTRTTARDFTPV